MSENTGKLEEIAKNDGKWIVVSDGREISHPEFVRGPLIIEQNPLEGGEVFLRDILDQAPYNSRYYQKNISHCYRNNGCVVKVTPINYWR